jgi:hypothetical protein
MASYKILSENSTLGAPGTVITDADIIAAPADIDLLVESGIVEPVTKPTTKEKD